MGYECDSTTACHEENVNVEIFENRDDEFYLTLIIAAESGHDHKLAQTVGDRLKRDHPAAFGAIQLDETVRHDYMRKFCKTKCGLDKIVGDERVHGTADALAGKVSEYLGRVYSVRQDVAARVGDPGELLVGAPAEGGGAAGASPAGSKKYSFQTDHNHMCHGTNYQELSSKYPDIHSKFIKSAEECTKSVGCKDQKKCIGDVFNCAGEQFFSMTTDKKTNEHSLVMKYPQLGSCVSKRSSNEFSNDIKCMAGAPVYKWLDTSNKTCMLVDEFDDPINDNDGNQMEVPLSSYSSSRLGSVVNQASDSLSLAACKMDLTNPPKCRKISVETIHVNPGSSGGEPTINRCCSERYVAVKDIECEQELSTKREEDRVESTFTCEKRSAYSKLYGSPIKFDPDADPPTDSCFCQELTTANNQGDYDGHKQGMTNQLGRGVGRWGRNGAGAGAGAGTFVSKCLRASFLAAVGLLFMVLYLRVLY